MYLNCHQLRKRCKKNNLPYYYWTKDNKFRYYHKDKLIYELDKIGKVDKVRSYFASRSKIQLYKTAFRFNIKIKLTDTKKQLIKKLVKKHNKLFILKFD